METNTCTGKSAEHAKPNSDVDKLELPIPGQRIPDATLGNKQLARKISWQYLPKLMSRPEFLTQRSADRCFVEFDLHNPTQGQRKYPAELLDSIF
jgi:hypothetical protein